MDAAEQTAERAELRGGACAARGDRPQLERGEAPLDQSIELYQEGDRLKRHCEARLEAAQARIEQIAFGADGQPTGVKPVRCRLRRSTGRRWSSTPKPAASAAEVDDLFAGYLAGSRTTGATACSRRCAMRRSAAASGFGPCSRSRPRGCSRSPRERALRAGAAIEASTSTR